MYVTYEEFKDAALDLGYEVEKEDNSRITNFLINDVGVAHFDGMYTPVSHAFFRYWSDEILCDQLRWEVLARKDAEIALDYLELLAILERK